MRDFKGGEICVPVWGGGPGWVWGGELGDGEVETHARGKCGNGTFAFWCPHLKRKLYCLVELNTEQLIYASSNPSNQLFRNISGDGVITYPATFQNRLSLDGFRLGAVIETAIQTSVLKLIPSDAIK